MLLREANDPMNRMSIGDLKKKNRVKIIEANPGNKNRNKGLTVEKKNRRLSKLEKVMAISPAISRSKKATKESLKKLVHSQIIANATLNRKVLV